MVLGPQEITLIFVAIILLFGASKIPDLARSLGKATGEFKKAKEETDRELKDFERSLTENSLPETDRSSKIKQMASDLGIDTEGKSDDQLLEDIQKKMKK